MSRGELTRNLPEGCALSLRGSHRVHYGSRPLTVLAENMGEAVTPDPLALVRQRTVCPYPIEEAASSVPTAPITSDVALGARKMYYLRTKSAQSSPTKHRQVRYSLRRWSGTPKKHPSSLEGCNRD